MPPQLLYDLETIDFSRVEFDIEAIRRVNPQRNQMEQLTCVVHVDTVHHGLVGYKDITEDEFWVPGHMPGFPLMPGVVMCEAAAQLAAFYACKYKLLGGDFVGIGGMDEIRFRAPVFPNCRLVLMVRTTELRPKRRVKFDFQGVVDGELVFHGCMTGVPIHRNPIAAPAAAAAAS